MAAWPGDGRGQSVGWWKGWKTEGVSLRCVVCGGGGWYTYWGGQMGGAGGGGWSRPSSTWTETWEGLQQDRGDPHLPLRVRSGLANVSVIITEALEHAS